MPVPPAESPAPAVPAFQAPAQGKLLLFTMSPLQQLDMGMESLAYCSKLRSTHCRELPHLKICNPGAVTGGGSRPVTAPDATPLTGLELRTKVLILLQGYCRRICPLHLIGFPFPLWRDSDIWPCPTSARVNYRIVFHKD